MGRESYGWSAIWPAALVALVATAGYISLRARLLDTRDRVGALEAQVARTRAELNALQPTTTKTRIGRTEWKLPAALEQHAAATGYAISVAEIIDPQFRKAALAHRTSRGHAIVVRIHVDTAGKSTITWVEPPAQSDLTEALEQTLTSQPLPPPPASIAAVIQGEGFELTFEP